MPKVRPFFAVVKAAAACAAVFATPVLAEETHGEMVVTANRVETESEKIGSAVTVITAEQIERGQKTTVAEVLRDVPGLAVSQTGGAGRTTAVRIRGAESYHTKVIIDGVDMSDPSRSQPQYEFGNLLTADIERIEVVRGPQSLLYGGEAVGGVINITTRKGLGKPRVSAVAEIGSLHTYTAGTNVSGSQDRVSYAFGVTHFETDGISAASKNNGNNEHDPYTNDTVNARLGLQLTDIWDVEASGRFTRAKVDTDAWSGGRARDDDAYQRTFERSGRMATNLALLDGRFKNTVAYSVSEAERDIRAGRRTSNGAWSFFDGESQKLEYQGTAKLAPDNHTIVFGAENKQDSTKQSNLSKDVTDNGYYADYQFSPLDSLFLTMGGRLDDHQTFGTHKTGRATAAYLVDATATRLHGSYGTGFRAPSLYELFHPTYGNQALKPEESRGWDAGVEQQLLNGRAAVDVTWFDNRIQNLIQWNNTYSNIASTRARGAELGGHFDVTQDLRLNATYTFTDSRNNTTGQILARRPKNQASFGAAWQPLEGVTTDATMRAVGRQYDSATSNYVGGFVTFDLAASYQLTDWAKIYGRVENLLNKQYEEVDTYGAPGRMVFAGVKASF